MNTYPMEKNNSNTYRQAISVHTANGSIFCEAIDYSGNYYNNSSIELKAMNKEGENLYSKRVEPGSDSFEEIGSNVKDYIDFSPAAFIVNDAVFTDKAKLVEFIKRCYFCEIDSDFDDEELDEDGIEDIVKGALDSYEEMCATGAGLLDSIVISSEEITKTKVEYEYNGKGACISDSKEILKNVFGDNPEELIKMASDLNDKSTLYDRVSEILSLNLEHSSIDDLIEFLKITKNKLITKVYIGILWKDGNLISCEFDYDYMDDNNGITTKETCEQKDNEIDKEDVATIEIETVNCRLEDDYDLEEDERGWELHINGILHNGTLWFDRNCNILVDGISYEAWCMDYEDYGDGTFSGIWIADKKIDMEKGANYKVEWL